MMWGIISARVVIRRLQPPPAMADVCRPVHSSRRGSCRGWMAHALSARLRSARQLVASCQARSASPSRVSGFLAGDAILTKPAAARRSLRKRPCSPSQEAAWLRTLAGCDGVLGPETGPRGASLGECGGGGGGGARGAEASIAGNITPSRRRVPAKRPSCATLPAAGSWPPAPSSAWPQPSLPWRLACKPAPTRMVWCHPCLVRFLCFLRGAVGRQGNRAMAAAIATCRQRACSSRCQSRLAPVWSSCCRRRRRVLPPLVCCTVHMFPAHARCNLLPPCLDLARSAGGHSHHRRHSSPGRRPAAADCGRGGAHCAHLGLHVQLCKGPGG